jgi:hypothetical protein
MNDWSDNTQFNDILQHILTKCWSRHVFSELMQLVLLKDVVSE